MAPLPLFVEDTTTTTAQRFSWANNGTAQYTNTPKIPQFSAGDVEPRSINTSSTASCLRLPPAAPQLYHPAFSIQPTATHTLLRRDSSGDRTGIAVSLSILSIIIVAFVIYWYQKHNTKRRRRSTVVTASASRSHAQPMRHSQLQTHRPHSFRDGLGGGHDLGQSHLSSHSPAVRHLYPLADDLVQRQARRRRVARRGRRLERNSRRQWQNRRRRELRYRRRGLCCDTPVVASGRVQGQMFESPNHGLGLGGVEPWMYGDGRYDGNVNGRVPNAMDAPQI